MSADVHPSPMLEALNASQPIINDFSITVGTANGSGSQTSNTTLLRALFKMGIPVSGKNLFPSNIQGLPTWYTIRVSKDGYLARREEHEIVVAINPDSFARDLKDVSPGGVFFYDDSIRMQIDRTDIYTYPMPVKKLTRDSGAPANLRNYIANMVYVGVLAQMLGIDLEKIYMALDFHFDGKQKAIDLNMNVVRAAAQWAAENLVKKDPYRVEPMDKTNGLIMVDGNTASALGAVYGGVQFVSWYPITPASSLAEKLNEYLPKFRKDPETGKNTYVVIQAEDELAAAGMAIGAGWAGLRAMSSTSGPGISLMTEFVGLAYAAEVPVVIWDVVRVGPSTGLPTRTSQGDLTMVYFLGHGDTDNIILLPATGNECFELGWKAFDYAERFQTPVFVITDLDLGMNQWMTEPFRYPETEIDRGKVLWEEDLQKLTQPWGRYKDVDGDGIPWRTVPGNRHHASAYFTRGTGHNEYAKYSEEADVWEAMQNRIKAKFETARKELPAPVTYPKQDGAKIGILAFGSTEAAILEARDQLQARHNLPVDFMRIRALPMHADVRDFVNQYDRVYVVELNRDGQLHQILTIEMPEHAHKLISLAHLDGLPLTAKWVRENLLQAEEK
ncbi:MAG: 2-oxoacid:acceptor oxidoreductase subunit alpha [Anaerolineales bacterium]